MRIRWLLSRIRPSPPPPPRAFAFPYGRHRLPLAVSQRSLCNILSSRERCAIRFRVRVRTTLVCVSPGQVNVLRLAVRRERGAARKKGANGKERERHTAKRGVLQILRLPSRSLPPPMNAFLPVRGATQKSFHSERLRAACSIQCACATSARRCIIQ